MLSRHLVPLFHAVGMPRHALPMAPCVGRPSATPALSLFAVAARRKTSDSAPPEPTVHAAEAPATKRGKSSKAASKDSASLPQSAEGPPSLGDPPEAPASGAKAQPAPAAAAPARAAGQASAPPAAATTSAEATHLPGEPADEDKPQEKAPRAKPVPTQPPTRAKEQELWDQGFKHIVGVDEAGLGAPAGPLVAVACTIPREAEIPTALRSNQRLSDKRRREVFKELMSIPGFVYKHHFVEVDDIDEMNPRNAALMAMAKAAGQMPAGAIDYVLVDGNAELDEEEVPFPSDSVVKGAESVAPIAAASVICKCLLDDRMMELDEQYPEYRFAQHKGYGSTLHRDLIHEHGPQEGVHRKSFKPAKELFGWTR